MRIQNSLSLLGSFWGFSSLAAGATIPSYFRHALTTRADLNPAEVQLELAGQVSNKTIFFGPEDSRFEESTARWNVYAKPLIQLVVVPGREEDVPTIVKYCNQISVDFLTVSGGHGYPHGLGTFNGIQIDMANLRSIDIQDDGDSAWFGGGVTGGQVTRYLWDEGFVTTTGSCNCVSLAGPTLGGGHGRHEGFYGMASDNLRQLNMVLGNGTAVRVNSTNHEDLFWAMQGAGHNFGIVTSMEMNIFPRGPDTWHYHNYNWRGDALEDVFEALNALHGNGTTPVNMALNYGNFLMNTTETEEEPVLSWTFAYRGSAEEAEELLAPFNDIDAFAEESGDVPYPEISVVQQTDEDSFLCETGNIRITSTAGLQKYNITAERLIFDGFKRRAASNPELAAGASITHEGYSTEAVTSKDPAEAAYPFREDHHLNLAQIVIPPNDADMERAALEWAGEVRDLWNQGQPGRTVNAYVNYANGLETLEQIYGHEKWRLERLRGLKSAYDPDNRFRFFNPIVPGNATRW